MSGVGEASLVLGIISSIISIVTAAKELYDTANNVNGLPKAFHHVAEKLPIILVILKDAKDYTERPDVGQVEREAFQKILARCEKSADELHEIFKRVIPKNGASSFKRYWSAARKIGKSDHVEDLIEEILKEVALLSVSFSFSTQTRLDKALGKLSTIEPSLLDKYTTTALVRVNSGRGAQHNKLFKGKTLKEINYQSDQSRLELTNKQDPKDFFHNWLLPANFPVPNPTCEQKYNREKQFRNPETSYTTCEWFFKTTEYFKLVDPEAASVLRIKGSPGCGKSVLSAAIIDRIQTLNLGAMSPLILYCYGRRDPEPTSSMALVRVLLAQTLRWETPKIMLEFQKLNHNHKILKEHDSKMEEELWSLLRTILALKTEKVCIVIDGLDEYTQPLVCVRSLIKVTTVLAATNKCSLLLSSRLERRDVFDNKIIQAALEKAHIELSQLEMAPELTCQDLTEFVAYQVTSQSEFLSSSQKIQDRIIRGVCGRANGMFLYASLVLEDLRGEKISSISAIDITLANLPLDLFNSYNKSLEVPRRSMKGHEVFSWIFCSNPALSWSELKSALAIGTSGYDEDEIIHDSCEAFIEHSCGQLVESFGESEQLRFIHPTVKDFLGHSEGLDDIFEISRAHSMVSSKILTFLEYPDLPSFHSDIDNPEEIIKTYTLRTGRGLYSFATFNWYKHLKECDKSENSGLEKQVRRFLGSPEFIRWLKSAIIMSHAFRNEVDSASLAADVIDCLQGWLLGRTLFYSDTGSMIQAWIKDFLNLMLDWGQVLEIQPDWIHYLHCQLLSKTSYFQQSLEHDGDQSIIQFHTAPVLTKSSETVTWPSRCFAVDLKRDLAFTYDEPFISCYHMKTGLVTAEIHAPVPSKIRGPLVVRKGVLCPQGKYLAVIFEAMGPSTDPVGAKIRAGRYLNLNFTTTGFVWEMDNATKGLNLSTFLAHMALGIDYAEFVVYLLELQHEGPARTHLFGFPSWATSPVLTIGSSIMRWELDDVDVLHFSDDSSRLATPFGIFNVQSGENVKPWSFALGHFFQGGKITSDFKTFGTVHRGIEGGSIVQLHDVDDIALHRDIKFPGSVHILAISNHGRFLLMISLQVIKQNRKAETDGVGIPSQQGSVGILDCHSKKWTPLLLLDRRSSQKLTYWNFYTYLFPPKFGPETEGDNDVNRVLLYAPPKWKLASNVRSSKSFNPMEAHLLLFEAKRSSEEFGKHPILKLQLPATAIRSESTASDYVLTFLSWSPHLDTATIYHDLCITPMSHEQLKDSALNLVKYGSIVTKCDASSLPNELQVFSVLLAPPTGSVAFHIKISISPPESDDEALIQIHHSKLAMSQYQSFIYEISVACLMTGENQATFSTVKHAQFPTIYYPPLDLQYFCVADENSMSLGCIELDIIHKYAGMSISVRDPNESVFQRALRSFKFRAHPLKVSNSAVTMVEPIEKHHSTRYAIFDDTEICFDGSNRLSGGATGSFIVNGETTVQHNRHIFQFSRCLLTNLTTNQDREARQFEVFLCVYDATRDDISWMIHTTTGGEISSSRDKFPETAWALHPHLPLLAWLLPGHKMRLSNLESHESPISIAESLVIEVGSTQAMKFSSDGRYIVVQAREAFKNDFCNMPRSQNLWSVMLCDLLEGKTIGATLTSSSNVSIEIGDEILHMYRLTRDGAIEISNFTLPDLVLSERQYLTFIPAHCCCPTCGKPFESQCSVSIMEYEDIKSVVLGHTPMKTGRSYMDIVACEPLIIRISNPPVELNLADIQDALFSINSSRLFPKILSDQREILDGAFDEIRRTCVMKPGVQCSCAVCSTRTSPISSSSESNIITQMKTNMSDFKLPSGLQRPPEQIEEIHRLSENANVKALSLSKETRLGACDIRRMKAIVGDETFPWDSWTEFYEAMEEIKEEFDYRASVKCLFEPGNCGAGYQIPLFVHTFTFHSGDEKDFHWSSAMTIGWIEEDLELLHDRLIGGDFEGARQWYSFPAYQAFGVKMEGLRKDKTFKGDRFRKFYGDNKEGKIILDIPLPKEDSKDIFVAGGVEFDKEIKPMMTGLIIKDYFDCLSDLVPGLGKVFEERLHKMMGQNLISELVE